MKTYLELVKNVLENGKIKANRTGTRALTIAGAMLQHDMSLGYPLLTTKKMAFKAMKVELEFFIKGLHDKQWLQERGCKIWNEWASPEAIPSGLSEEERKAQQIQEHELGPIYGVQWRDFGGKSTDKGVDQLKLVVEKLKSDPNDRRMLVSAWNPLEINSMALPPCHVLFHLVHIDGVLNLTWFQRSCDVMLGIPFNLSSYALLLHLLCLDSGFTPGLVTGMLSDVHIYEDHLEGAKTQIKREPLTLPQVKTDNFTSLFNWQYSDTQLLDYQSHEKISFPIAV